MDKSTSFFSLFAKGLKITALWLVSLCFFFIMVGSLPAPAGFTALEALLLVLPIAKWQECVKLVIPKWWIKLLALLILAILTFSVL